MRPTSIALAALTCLLAARADEGMWTFDNIPSARMKASLGFIPTAQWLDHVRLSVVRFPGGTGSIVSKDGLVLTNHHVGHNWIQSVSEKGKDFVKDGFVAASREQEVKVPGLSLDVLMEMENVTAKVDAAVKPGMTDAQAGNARKEVLAGLVKADQAAHAGLKVEAVSLYQGGESWIYRYKTHKDIRLVMAPEYDVAAFGKEVDNFSYPRHDLDFSMFRIYENDKPLAPAHHLTWSPEGAQYGDATFTIGHPGTTNRLWTVAQIRYAKEVSTPLALARLDKMRKALREQEAKGGEAARQVSAQIMGVENSFKVMSGEQDGMKDESIFKRLEAAEKDLRDKVAKDAKLQAMAGQSWTKIAQAMKERATFAKDAMVITFRGSQLLGAGVNLLRLAGEPAKPEATRLPEFRKDEQVQATKTGLLKGDYKAERELATITQLFKTAQDELGAKHPYVIAALGGKAPADVAKALVEGTKLMTAEARKPLVEGGAKALAASQDPLIALARKIEPLERALRMKQTANQDLVAEHQARIAKARFAVYGKDAYPDATFTLRLSYGKLETYPVSGSLAPPFTTFGGLFDRADAWGPKAEHGSWALPQRWQDARTKLDLRTPYNFITSNDITGGNSGSPLVNKQGHVIGLAFDGNIESLVGRYFFDGKANRTLCVDTRAIVESLRTVYQAPHLVSELTGK